MQLKLCIIFAACVYAHPVQDTKIINKNMKKHIRIPTVDEVKALEKEIWKATSSGNLSRAVKLENKLEADILKAAILAVMEHKKDPVRSKRQLKELGAIVRRDKRTVKMLSTVVNAGTKVGLNLLLGNSKVNRTTIGNKTLKRIPRQGKPYFFPKQKKSSSRSDISNEIFPPLTTPSATTFNPDSIDITTSASTSTKTFVDTIELTTSNSMSIETTTTELDALRMGSNKEEVTPRVPARQEEEEEDEEEGGGGLGGLITSFLGSLSTPEGGVDLDAVTGLLGGISTQNDDGTYDFQGLQDTVGSLFGGSEEGGSNVGLFLGGLIGAIIRGSAGDDAAKGAGRLAGNLLGALLPGLSAFPTPEDDEDAKPQEGLDSGGFLTGFLSTVIGGLGGLSNSNSSGGGGGGGGEKPGSGAFLQVKFQLFRAVFGLLTKVLGASSTSKQTPTYGNGGTYYGPPPPQN